MINKFVHAMETKNYLELSQLCSDDVVFADTCPKGLKQSDYFVYGKEAVEMFYRNRFTFGRHYIKNVKILSDTKLEFISVYDGYLVAAHATLTIIDGLITMVIIQKV